MCSFSLLFRTGRGSIWRCVRQWHAQRMRIPKHRPRSRQFDKRQGDNSQIRFPSGFSHEKVTQNARAAENTGVIVNGAWRGETCCDKQTRRGRGKNTEAPPLRPFLPFPYFSTVPQTSFWSSSLISLFSDESETAARRGYAGGSEVAAVRTATVLS